MTRGPEPSLYQRLPNLKALLRPAGWGAAAAAALSVAVFSATTTPGSQRLAAAFSPSPNQATAAVPTVPLAQFEKTEAETRRLADAVRSLTTDRERLADRIASLERNLEDVTGSIQRQSVAAAPPPTEPVSEPASPPATPALEPNPALASASSAPPVSAPAQPAVPVESDGTPRPDAAPDSPRAAYGVDVGGAVNFEGLRALWNSTRTAFAATVEGMRPILGVREHPKTRNTEFRLVIGPLPDAEAAADLCAAMSAARRYCRPVPFEGQQLSFAAAAPTPAKRPTGAQQDRKAPRATTRSP